MTKRKKIIILSCMVALLAVTAIFNFVLSSSRVPESNEPVSSSASYFTQYRTERLTTRNEEILQLDAVIASAEENSLEYNQALSMKTTLTANTEKELLLENLIRAYGFEDAVVMIGLESENVNVIAKAEELTTDDAIIIYTIIEEEIAISPENVKIIPIS